MFFIYTGVNERVRSSRGARGAAAGRALDQFDHEAVDENVAKFATNFETHHEVVAAVDHTIGNQCAARAVVPAIVAFRRRDLDLVARKVVHHFLNLLHCFASATMHLK